MNDELYGSKNTIYMSGKVTNIEVYRNNIYNIRITIPLIKENSIADKVCKEKTGSYVQASNTTSLWTTKEIITNSKVEEGNNVRIVAELTRAKYENDMIIVKYIEVI